MALISRLQRLGPGLPPVEKIPITPAQLILLDWIAAHPGCRIREVATGLGLTPPTISVGVQRLERLGLLVRKNDPGDRRAVQLNLTPQGKELHRRVQEFRRRKARWLLAGLSGEERETLLALLERAIAAAEQEERRSDEAGEGAAGTRENQFTQGQRSEAIQFRTRGHGDGGDVPGVGR